MGKQIPLVFLNPLFSCLYTSGCSNRLLCVTSQIFDAGEVAFLKTYETVLSLGVCVCARAHVVLHSRMVLLELEVKSLALPVKSV